MYSTVYRYRYYYPFTLIPSMALFMVLAAPLSAIDLATFGNTIHRWHVENDPVMGGQSVSTLKNTTTHLGKQVGEWIGECRIVPSLGAPGFTIAMTEDPTLGTAKFPNVAKEDGLTVTLRNVKGNVTQFKVAFCDTHIDPYRCQFGTYKANFTAKHSNGFTTVFLPWDAFTDKWSPSTGEPTAHDPPNHYSLASISQVQLWVEGIAGDFHVEIEGIRADKKPMDIVEETGAYELP